MPKVHVFLKFWLLVLLWMVVIFSASSDTHSYQHSSRLLEPLLHWLFPTMSQAHVEDIHLVIRKCAHLTEYAILALLGLARGCRCKPRTTCRLGPGPKWAAL